MKKLGIIVCSLVFVSCSLSKTTVSKEKAAELKQLVDSKNFKISSHTAMPMASIGMQQVANSSLLGAGNTANSIDITSNTNYFKVEKELLSVSLPFYGETRSTRFSGNVGYIEFEGIPMKSDITFNNSKNHYEMNFEFSNKNELFKVRIQVYLNSKTRITVIAGNRSSITYLGVVQGI